MLSDIRRDTLKREKNESIKKVAFVGRNSCRNCIHLKTNDFKGENCNFIEN